MTLPAEPCTCVRGVRVCDFHYDLTIEYRLGDAAHVGAEWADSVAQRYPILLLKPWPPLAGKVVAQAKAKVKGWAAGDKRLLNVLGRTCYTNAAIRWRHLQHVSRLVPQVPKEPRRGRAR